MVRERALGVAQAISGGDKQR
eukprot:COSAG03_NODE_12579_length_540_cov_33.680272_1_plen_20_part_01